MSERSASESTSAAELRRSLIEDLLITHLQQQSEEDIDDAEIVAQHPDLMPELGEQLQLLREIADQRVANNAMDTADANGGASTIRCPHCRERIVVSTLETFSDITCSGCGSCFSLAEDTTKDASAAQVKKVDQFELVEQIGFGSFGIVWRARDTELERWVAIKIPRRGKLSPREVEQFKRESRAAARLSHPNIVSVYGVGTDETLYIVSDLVDGVSLSEHLAEQPPTIQESCELCVTVAEALQHAHDAGVIHRDLKPQNIMLDADGKPHLLDFGLARQTASEITMTLDGHVLGTPAYMPPEQARGGANQVGCQADIYSLGVILFQLLTGELPFRGNTRMLLHQVLHEDAPSPRRLNNRISKDLETICLKCLEKEPRLRFDSAQLLANELRRCIEGIPVLTRPISLLSCALRWSKRNQGMAAAIASIATLLIAGTIGALQYARDADQLRMTADSELQRARQNLYAADVGLASASIQRKNLGAARGLLSHQAENAPDLLGIEWRLLWNQAKGDQIETLGPFPTTVCSLCPIADDLLAVGTISDGVYLCEYPSGRSLDTLELGSKIVLGQYRTGVNKLLYLEKANRLVHFSNTGIQMWQGPEWKKIEIPNHESNSRQYNSGTVSPSGDFVAAGYRGGISIWSAPSMEFVGEMTCNPLPFQSVVFAGSDSRIAFGNRETIEVWEFQSEPFVTSRKWKVDHNTSSLYSNNKWLVSASWSGDLTTWDIESGMVVHERPEAHGTFIFGLAMNSTGDVICTGGGDQLIGRWHFPSLAPIGFMPGHGDEVWSIRSLDDQIISGGRDRTVRIWDSNPANAPPSPVGLDNVCQFTHDGRYLVGNHRSDGLTVWKTSTFQPTKNLNLEGRLVAITPSNKLRLASYEDHLKVVTVDPTSGNTESTRHFPNVTSTDLEWNQVGSHFAVRSDDAIEVWSVEKASMTSVFPPDRCMFGISADGEVVATLDEHDWTRINLWKLGGVEPVSIDSGITSFIQSTAFSPDGVCYAIASHDGSLSFWNAADGAEVGRVIDSRMGPGRIKFSPDSRTLIGWNRSHVRFWSVSTQREIMRIDLDNVNSRGNVANDFSISPDGRFMAFDLSTGDTEIWQAPYLP